tara:strand:+ start:2278 stop:2850 length:573 start_codon:yes stop_codon:yes gene_type:complete
MQQFLQFTGPAIILLYLIISANFTAEVFGCKLQHYLKTNTIAKHIVGIMTMIFFVVGTADWSQEHDFWKYSGFAISYYFIFLLTTRLPFRFLISILILFTIMYYIEIYKNSLLASNKDGLNPLSEVRNMYVFQDIYKYQQFFLKAALLLIFFGFVIYFKNHQSSLGEKFNIFSFMSANTGCSGNSNKYIS